ncbi:terminase, partial [Streptomyces sp. A73]|nr:terminase [Streptomyces sp. A73]
IEAVTSSPRALEGGRPTAVNLGETHHWLESNQGHEMAAVSERNATKSADGQTRTLANTNAYEPGEDSVAERTREAFESTQSG